jgi:hypothetical protein
MQKFEIFSASVGGGGGVAKKKLNNLNNKI